MSPVAGERQEALRGRGSTRTERPEADHHGVGRVATIVAPGEVELRDVPRRPPGTGHIEIRVEGCGICGSNLPVWEGRPWFEYPLTPGNPGHEGWGTVMRVGRGVKRPREGDRVAYLSDTAFADYDVVPADHALVLPEDLDGAPFPGEPLACAMNVMSRAGVRPGARVAIVGVGFLGALLTQMAARAGAHVMAASRRRFALDVASVMGAAATLPIDDPDGLVERALDRAGGLCDVVIEATGAQAGLDLAGALVRERGRLVVAGFHQDGPRQVDMQLWNWRGIDVVNAHERDPLTYMRGMREAAVAVAEGELVIDGLLTHVFPLDEIGDALEMARTRPPRFLKALVVT